MPGKEQWSVAPLPKPLPDGCHQRLLLSRFLSGPLPPSSCLLSSHLLPREDPEGFIPCFVPLLSFCKAGPGQERKQSLMSQTQSQCSRRGVPCSRKSGSKSAPKDARVRRPHSTESLLLLLGGRDRPGAHRKGPFLYLSRLVVFVLQSRSLPTLGDQPFLPLWPPVVNGDSGTP